MRIFVTVGTHEDPFDRLVLAAQRLAEAGHEVRIQRGTSVADAPDCTSAPTLSSEEMEDAFAWADVVIAHGGPSTLVEAAAHGHVPILVPRRAVCGEHVDDHQLWFSRRIASRVHVVEDPETLVAEVARHAERSTELDSFGPDRGRTLQFARDLEALCETLVAEGPPSRRGRGRLRALMRWVRRSR